MPSLIDIRRRVRSVKNTQQITKAMKMVAAAKLRRAQERVVAARPYATMLEQMLASVSGAARGNDKASELPLLAVRPEQRVQLILVTADRGLAGGFNTNLIKAAQRFLVAHAGKDIVIEAVGRKGRDFFAKRAKLSGEHIGLVNKVAKLTYAETQTVTQRVTERYINGEIDAVYLIYNEFRSVMSQRVVMERLLPIPKLPAFAEASASASATADKSAGEHGEVLGADYLFEPSPAELLNTLLPFHVAVQVNRALLESSAAEHAARMTAMDAATRNAKEMVDRLTLYMNKVRQAAITREIIEIVAGAQAT